MATAIANRKARNIASAFLRMRVSANAFLPELTIEQCRAVVNTVFDMNSDEGENITDPVELMALDAICDAWDILI